MHEQRMQLYILKRHFVHMAVMLAVFVTSISYTLLNFPESRHGYETFLAGVIGLPCFLCLTILKGPSSPTLHCAPRTLQLPFSMQPKIRNSVTVKVICFHRTSNGPYNSVFYGIISYLYQNFILYDYLWMSCSPQHVTEWKSKSLLGHLFSDWQQGVLQLFNRDCSRTRER